MVLFLNRYKNIFSQNLIADIFANLFSYGKSTFKKDFSNKNYSKVVERIREKDEYKNFARIFENIIQIVFENKDNYKGIGNGEVFELLPNNLKDFKDLWIIQKNIIEEKEIKNCEVLEKFLNKEEIDDIISKNFKLEKIITLKSFHYQFCLYASHFFQIDYEKFIKSFFNKKNNDVCKENLLKLFFKSSYCNVSNYDDYKRNIRNIINQKNIMKYSTFRNYFNGIEGEGNKKLLYLIYYALYLYLDFLEFLKKEFEIDKDIFCKFIKEIKRRN